MVDALVITKASQLEARIRYRFGDKQLLYDAIVRRGFENERANEPVRAQRRYGLEALANLGDAVIDVLATEHLILDHRLDDKGALTQWRQRLVRREHLTSLGRDFQLQRHLAMSEGERLDLGRSAILGEAVESLVGAVYLDGVGRGANLRDARHVLARFDLFLKDLR